MKLGADGYLQFDGNTDQLHVKIGAPSDYTVPLNVMNYHNSFLSVNLDNTALNFDDINNIAGLYTSDNYLLKIYTASLEEMGDNFEEAFEPQFEFASKGGQ